jgi:hypothetical protein
MYRALLASVAEMDTMPTKGCSAWAKAAISVSAAKAALSANVFMLFSRPSWSAGFQ